MVDSPVEVSQRVQRVFRSAPVDLALIGSRRMNCSGVGSDWDFCAPDDPATIPWLRTMGFKEVEDYNGPVRAPHGALDVNTKSVWEKHVAGWVWQSGSWFMPGLKINVMVVRDPALCVMAYEFVARDPELIRDRHSTKTWNRVYDFLLLGNPFVVV